MWLLLFLLLGVSAAQTAQALSFPPPELYSGPALVLDFSSGPVAFDFEAGLDGWHLLEGSQRVQTPALGGDWAVSGDGMLFLHVDLSNVGAISLRRTRRNGGLGLEDDVVVAWLGETYEIAPGIEVLIGFYEFDPPAGDDAAPGLLAIPDAVRALDRGLVLSFVALGEETSGGIDVRGFVDEITFHPIPETGTGTLLALSLMILARRNHR